MPIKNVIFDLGGVIINIDYQKTLQAFRELGAQNIEEVYSQSKQDALFDSFDTGKITQEEFREKLTKRLGVRLAEKDFDQAWNAMLLDLPSERLEFIKKMGQNHRVFLFSNTNSIHLPEVFRICQRETGFINFDGLFERQYYSHIFGMRKPDKAAFQAILDENGLNASETLFIDDSIQHIVGAREAGLHAVHITPGMSIFDVEGLVQVRAHTEEENVRETLAFSRR